MAVRRDGVATDDQKPQNRLLLAEPDEISQFHAGRV
jgi:hypothetical protein